MNDQERIKQLEELLVSKDLEIQQVRSSLKNQVDEVARCAVSAQQLLGHLSTRQQEGDALRRRLQKVTNAFEAANNLIRALDSHNEEASATMRAAYSQALLDLSSYDDA